MPHLRLALLAVVAASLAWSALVAFTGGIDVSLAGIRIRSTDSARPVIVAVAAFVVFALVGGRLRDLDNAAQRAVDFVRRRAGLAALAVSLVAAWVGFALNTRVGIGSDTYGYVSQADLWLDGTLKLSQPWMADVPWRENRWTFSPLGYRPAPNEELAIVPTYSPGLPMVMALAKSVAGQCGLFAVVPFFGGLAVLATYLLGARLGTRMAGLVASIVVAMSPAFLAMLVEPLSDVPTMAAWTLATWCALGRSRGHAFAAGLFASLGILIRPNLVMLAAPLAAWPLVRSGGPPFAARLQHSALFSAATLPGALFIAILNDYLYGSPLSSGYGSPGDLFAWSRVGENFTRYASWFVTSQSPIALAGVAALAVPLRAWWPQVADRRVFWLSRAMLVLLLTLYLTYFVFDDWGYLRFLLPAWPWLMLGLATVLVWAARFVPARFAYGRLAIVAGMLAALTWWQVSFAREAGVFDYQRLEQHEVRLAQFVRELTPAKSVVLTIERSGTVRYYAGRETLRYDYLDSVTFDRDMAWLEARGIRPYALLDRAERDEFSRKFPSARVTTGLGQPALVYEPRDVFLVDLSGEPRTAPVLVPRTPETPLGCVPPEPVPPLW